MNTLQELWDYAEYCPVCDKNCRNITISVGPDKAFSLLNHNKIEERLFLDCKIRFRNEKYYVNYVIDCNTGEFNFELSNVEVSSETEVWRVSKSYFYFYIHSNCYKCDCSYMNSGDIEIDPVEKKTFNYQVDRETVYLLKSKDKFHITLLYDQNSMQISKCFIDQDGLPVDDNKIIRCPIIALDLSDYDKLINKIKTLILFS